MLAHIEAVLPPEVRTIGTIEGELEGLIIHGTKRFLLYDRLTGRQVICYFGDAVSWKGLRDVFGKGMAVTGEIRSRASGERASINVSKYYVFPREDELPSADAVRGLLRNAPIVDFRYWDSNAFLGWLAEEPDKIDYCRPVIKAAESGKVRILTSALTIPEVLWIKGRDRNTGGFGSQGGGILPARMDRRARTR